MARNVSVAVEVDASRLRSGLQAASQDVQKFVSQPAKVKIEVDGDAAAQELNEAGKKLVDTGKQVGDQAGDATGKSFASKFSGQLKEGLQGGLSNLGSSITGGIIGGGVVAGVQAATSVVVSGFQAVIDKGSEFQSSLAALSAITGVGGEDLDKFGEKAKELASQFGGDANTQIGAFQTILSKFGPGLAGTPDALNEVTKNVNVLAKAAGLDAQGAVDALSNAMLQFGIDASDPAKLAKESGRFINVLASSAKEGAAEIPQVAEAILQAGVAAKGANLSFEETNAAIQALAVGGKVGSEAGVALRNVLGLLIKQSGPGEEALKGVGLSVQGLGKTLTEQGLQAALAELQGGIDKLGTDAEKAAFKATLFGSENASAAGILLNNVENIGKFTTAMTGTSEATVQAEKNMATFSEFMSRVQANLGNVAINIFQGFEKAFGFIADAVSGTVGPAFEQIGGYVERAWSVIQPILAVIGGAIIAGLVNTINLVATSWSTVFGILNNVFDQIVAAFQPVVDAFKNLFGSNGAANEGIDVVKIFSDVLKFLGARLQDVGNFIAFVAGKIIGVLLTPLKLVGQAVAGVINWFADWIRKLGDVQTVISVTVEKIGNLVKAVLSFDLGAIKDAILDFGNIGSDVQKRMSAATNATQKQTAATNEQTKATDKATAAVVNLNNQEDKGDKGKGDDEKAKAAEKYAQELKKAKDTLADLQDEEAKRRELQAVDTLESVQAREQARIEIERKYREKALLEEKAALQTEGELRATQEKIIQAKIDAINKDAQEKINKSNAKAAADRVKQSEDNEKILTDIAIKQAEERVKGLQEKLKEGDIKVADDLIKAQRALTEQALTAQVDAIVQSAPQYKIAAKELQRQLEEGLLNEQQFKDRAANLRVAVLNELQALPASTTDAYAIKLRAAYSKATDEILQQTADVLKKVQELSKKNAIPSFAESLVTLGDVVGKIDFATIFNASAKEAEQATAAQEELIQKVKDGTLTYQEATDELATLTAEQQGTSSAALEALNAIFGAFAEQQRQAFVNAQTAQESYYNRNVEISNQLVELEKLKAEELKKVREDDAASRAAIDARYSEAKKKLDEETASNTEKANQLATASYANLAASAAASFAQMVGNGENALKALVLVALDALNALIPVLVAQITGVQLASPNPANALTGGGWGIAAAAALTAIFMGAVAAAKAAVSSGFEEGGYTGNGGTKQIAGVVHGQEFVMNAAVTKRNRALLEHLHAGRSLESFPALQSMLQRNNINTIPLTEIQMMRMELGAIRQRLDRMPDGLQSRVGVDVNVGMDTYLYERDRSRMLARRLRG